MPEIKKCCAAFEQDAMAVDEKLNSMAIDDYVTAELILHFCYTRGYTESPQKLGYLFGRLHKIGIHETTQEHYELDKICRKLGSISLYKYRVMLENYLKLSEKFRLYGHDKKNDRLFQLENINKYVSRRTAYDSWIETPDVKQRKVYRQYEPGKQYYFFYNDKEIAVTKKLPAVSHELTFRKKNSLPHYRVTLQEIQKAAKEMDGLIGQNIENGVPIKEENYEKRLSFEVMIPVGGGLQPTRELTVDKVCNILGQVGSGKSTLLDILAFDSVKKGNRICIITSKVSEAFNLAYKYNCLGLKTVPLCGHGSSTIDRHLNTLIGDDSDWLEGKYDRYRTGACPLDACHKALDNVVNFERGKEPCFGLYQKAGRGRKGTNTICPFYSICPRQKDFRDGMNADIIVTTIANYVYSRSPLLQGENGTISQDSFAEYIFENFNIVFFDEADLLQTKIDELFCGEKSLLEEHAEMKRLAQMIDNPIRFPMKSADKEFYRSYHVFTRMYDLLISFLKQKKAEKLLGNRPFSSAFLLNGIEETADDKNLLEGLREYCFEGKQNDEIKSLVDMEDRFPVALKNILVRYGIKDENKQYIALLAFTVMRFEKAVFEASYYFDQVNENELIPLRNTLKKIQLFVPNAPQTNVFSFRYEKETNNLIVFRKYGIGRSLMTGLPWIVLNEDGSPAGPDVVLLSGSSYIPDALALHIAEPVSYVLKSSERYQTFLRNVECRIAGTMVKVSGRSNINEGLEELSEEVGPYIEKALENNRRVLMIVNSYAECIHLRSILKNLPPDANPLALVSDKTPEDAHSLQLRNLEKFAQYDSRIMIAPAGVVSRGYNILDKDKNGHSAFSVVMYFIRMIPPPNQIKPAVCETNGWIYKKADELRSLSTYERVRELSLAGGRFWFSRFNNYYCLANLPRELQKNIIASRLAEIMQINGRLYRIADVTALPPVIYFLDAAFMNIGDEENPPFRLLPEIIGYGAEHSKSPEEKILIDSLYGTFMEKLKGELQ